MKIMPTLLHLLFDAMRAVLDGKYPTHKDDSIERKNSIGKQTIRHNITVYMTND